MRRKPHKRHPTCVRPRDNWPSSRTHCSGAQGFSQLCHQLEGHVTTSGCWPPSIFGTTSFLESNCNSVYFRCTNSLFYFLIRWNAIKFIQYNIYYETRTSLILLYDRLEHGKLEMNVMLYDHKSHSVSIKVFLCFNNNLFCFQCILKKTAKI